ncbi:3,4-dihydroxy-2-butanone-4-phosphate synthase [Celerinatantimonas sp. YJH-8]|uniref:3,4-dihydroxy-2-butanone-4-phosphate synthase n=1 Tax=Celerinatantimonas sp. YJH-8 TaxID=3228714 RepID=UPI0038BE8B83
MSQNLLTLDGDSFTRVETALAALRDGCGVLLVDDEDRENEGDIIYAAETITPAQMALMIRETSGIVCLCMEQDKMAELDITPMVDHNTSKNQTAFMVTIEARDGVTTGVSAADRVTTIQAAIADDAKPADLSRPGHVFPLCARTGGVLTRRGHTEGSVDLARLAGLKPYGVLAELTKEDGTMSRLPDVIEFSKAHKMPILTIEDLVAYRKR